MVTLGAHSIDKMTASSCWAKQERGANTKYNLHVSLTLKHSFLKCFGSQTVFLLNFQKSFQDNSFAKDMVDIKGNYLKHKAKV